jgi:DNA-directed RNA polymerase subunit M/transcription elongation factor TFIIS
MTDTKSSKSAETTRVETLNMVFCPECNSMLWPREMLTDEDEEDGKRQLFNYCRKCQYAEPSKRVMIASHVSRKTHKIPLGTSVYRSTDRVYDVTRERSTQVRCPNKACPFNKTPKLREVILIKNPDTQRITYLCGHPDCRHEWSDTH